MIYSLQGELLCEWPRAVHKGQWMTDQKHLLANYKNISEWNGPYFISKALTVGPCTVQVIKTILASRRLEVQTYRLCLGVLGFTKKYSKQALEECCSRAISLNKVTYTFIKNSIPAVAEELGISGFNTEENDERNEGAFIMDDEASDTETLLSRSQKLLDESRKEASES